MNIAINTRFLLSKKMEGFGWFTYETTKRIVRNHPEHTFYFFFDRKFDKKFLFAKNVIPVVLYPQARHPILFNLWFNFSVTIALKKYNIDVFVSPDGYVSLFTKKPQLAVIHDLNFEHYPNDLPKKISLYYKKSFPKFAHKSTRIVTVSEFSKKDLINTYKINPKKIDVAYNGVSDFYTPIPISKQKKIKSNLTNGNDFFIFIGSLHPRKNLARLLQAFDDFKTQDSKNMKLVIVGESLWKKSFGCQLIKKLTHRDDVIFTGHISSKKLNEILSSAYAMTFVSYFEGFGIPVAESMRCGVPVILSNRTSLPEVGGDAAIYVDPFDVESISNAMIELSNDKTLRQELSIKSIHQSKKFSWDYTAEKIWNAILKII